MRLSVTSYLFHPDRLGVIASTLCLIHCLATPFIFVAQSCAISCCASAPSWWVYFDYLFLTISFFAIRRSAQMTKYKSMKYALLISWSVLFVLIVNESIGMFVLNKNLVYIMAIVLSLLHIYNLNFCKCNEQSCCTTKI